MSEKKVVLTEGAPAAAHVLSQGVHKGGFLQVSGQGPMDPATNEYIGVGDVRAQTRRTLENIKAILAAGDMSVEDVLMFRVYLTRREDFDAMNEVYAEFVQENVPSGAMPGRTTVFVNLPHEVMLVEIGRAGRDALVQHPTPHDPRRFVSDRCSAVGAASNVDEDSCVAQHLGCRQEWRRV